MGAAEPSATEAAGRSSLFVCARGAAPQPGPSLQVSGARGILQQRVLRGERRQRGAVGAGAARAGRGRRSRAAVRSRRRGRRTAGWGWRPSGAGGGPCRRAAPPFLASAPPPRRPRPRAGRPGGAGLCSAPAPPPAPQLRDRPGAPLPSRLPPRSHRTCRYPNCPSRRRRFTQYAVPAAAAPASATHSAATAPAAAPAARVPPPTCGEAERHGGRGGGAGVERSAPLRASPTRLLELRRGRGQPQRLGEGVDDAVGGRDVPLHDGGVVDPRGFLRRANRAAEVSPRSGPAARAEGGEVTSPRSDLRSARSRCPAGGRTRGGRAPPGTGRRFPR